MKTTTDAAREAARDKTSGRFGEQLHTDPGAGVLPAATMPQDQAIGWIREDVWTASYDQVAAAFRGVGVPAGAPVAPADVQNARKWLRSQALIDMSERTLAAERDSLALARQRVGIRAVTAAVARIRQQHPDTVDTIRVVRGADGSASWEARDVDGQMLPIPGDVRELLAGYSQDIDFTSTVAMYSFATGRKWNGQPPAGAEFDSDGNVTAVEVAWRQL